MRWQRFLTQQTSALVLWLRNPCLSSAVLSGPFWLLTWEKGFIRNLDRFMDLALTISYGWEPMFCKALVVLLTTQTQHTFSHVYGGWHVWTGVFLERVFYFVKYLMQVAKYNLDIKCWEISSLEIPWSFISMWLLSQALVLLNDIDDNDDDLWPLAIGLSWCHCVYL